MRYFNAQHYRRQRERHSARGEDTIDALAFHRTPGPLLAIAGLCGGSGVTGLAYLIAAIAARESSGPVLVADTGGPSGGLACRAGVCAPRTLAELSEMLAAGDPVTGPLWADGEHGLRVLGGAPQFTLAGHPESIVRVLQDARQAHCLTVLDAGTLARPADQAALASATHVAWVLPASEEGAARAKRVLERVVSLPRPQIVVARALPGTGKPPIPALLEIAHERRAPLILMPALSDGETPSTAGLADRAQVALQAIGGVLARTPVERRPRSARQDPHW